MARLEATDTSGYTRRIEDGVIALKSKLPTGLYRSPPNWVGYLFLLPSVLLIGFLAAGLVLLFRDSFLFYDSVQGLTSQFTTENWTDFATSSYLNVLVRTLGLGAIITVLTVTLSFPYAYLTIRVESATVRKILLISVFTPFFTGLVIRAYGWLVILGENGLVNSVLTSIGLDSIRFLGTVPAVIIGALQIMIPYAVLMLAPAIESIDREMELAAQNLGANTFDMFRHVVIPLAMPGIAGATIVVFTISTTLYAVPEILGLGRVNFIANAIYSTIFLVGNRPLAAVMSLALVACTSILVLLIFSKIGIGTLNVNSGGDR
ncbi:ABC transporter permease [Natrarchaeobius sp. A-rgal3]|uniref:ABC transporter permease n=1 Tax=Natrarchaeobius versutus TaxID=1679078 RepID=UPI00350FE078